MTAKTYSPADLKKFQAKIEAQIERTESELKTLRRDRIQYADQEEANQSYGEDAKADQILSRLAEREEQQTQQLRELQAALARIENGTYGIDPDTGKRIRKERLLAEPTARHAISP